MYYERVEDEHADELVNLDSSVKTISFARGFFFVGRRSPDGL